MDAHLSDYLAVRLLAGMEDAAEWSADVRQALAVAQAWQARQQRALLHNRSAKRQLDAARSVLGRHLREAVKRRITAPTSSASSANRQTGDLTRRMQEAMRTEAHAQAAMRGRANPRSPRAGEIHSVADRWRWKEGRPPKYLTELLLLRVEVWRDMRALLQPELGRGSLASGLAAVLYGNMKANEPAVYVRAQRQWHAHEEREQRRYQEGCAPPRSIAALVRAMRDVLGKGEFRAIEARLSQVRKEGKGTLSVRRACSP